MTYQLNYDQGSQQLSITIVRCSNLNKADMMGGKPDPYVNVFLLPGNHTTMKTKVVKNEQNPMFNETFKIQVFFFAFY